MLDATDSLFCNGYSVVVRDDLLGGAWTLGAVERVLNSSVMHYYASVTSFSISGGYQCYQKNFIERFGLPPIPPDRVREIERCSDDEIKQVYSETLGLSDSLVTNGLDRYTSEAR